MVRLQRSEGALDLDPVTVQMRDTVSASQELAARMSRVLGMHPTDVQALYLLNRYGPMGAAELARRLGLRSASTTVVIDRLEQAGHAERRREERDRRRVTVSATRSALEASMAAWLPAIQAIDAVADALEPGERAVVVRYLAEVTEAMMAAAA